MTRVIIPDRASREIRPAEVTDRLACGLWVGCSRCMVEQELLRSSDFPVDSSEWTWGMKFGMSRCQRSWYSG